MGGELQEVTAALREAAEGTEVREVDEVAATLAYLHHPRDGLQTSGAAQLTHRQPARGTAHLATHQLTPTGLEDTHLAAPTI